MSVLYGPDAYLAYDAKNGEPGITHKAYISSVLNNEQIIETGQVPVNIETIPHNGENQAFK